AVGSAGGVRVRAFAGTRAVFFGLDLEDAVREECLGFSLRRVDHSDGDKTQWIPGFKTFRSVVPNPDPSTVYTTDKHPLQSLRWGDCRALPGRSYTYSIIPRFGAPAALTEKAGVRVDVAVTTSDPDAADTVHGVYFNRGVAASEAYQREFGERPSDLPPEK